MITKPELKEGERYIGATVDAIGALTHIILLPGDNNDATWQDQMEWAKSIGGNLPTRIEQSMLFATAKDEFKSEYYWSCEEYASDASYAWCQSFGYGLQHDAHKYVELRARAVRRLII